MFGYWLKNKEIGLVGSVRMAVIPEMKSGLLVILKVTSLKWPLNTVFARFAVAGETGLLLFSPDIILKPCRAE